MDHNGVPERQPLSQLNPRRDVLSNGSRGLRKGYPSPNLASTFPAFGYAANGSIKSSSDRDNGPLDEARKPQASSTSAAVGSPTFYTGGVNRGATKRFNSILADYSDGRAIERDEQDSGPASLATHARPKSPTQEYSSTSRLPSALQKRWWLQPAFRVRRKRSISAESTAYERATRFSSSSYLRQLSRRQALGILCLAALVLYFVFRRSEPIQPRATLQTARDPTRDPIALFERKWWDPPIRSSSTSARKRSTKRTSFVTPRHSLEELLRLPSHYPSSGSAGTIHETNHESTKQSFPSVAAVLDCSSLAFHETFSRALFVQHANSLLQSLSQQSLRPQSVHVVFPSLQTSETAPFLFGHKEGWLSSHVALDSTSAISILSKNNADFLLYLPCPVTGYAAAAGDNSQMIQQFLHVAGTAEYEDHILATSGMRISSTSTGKLRIFPVPAQYSSGLVRDRLEESEKIQIPTEPFFMRRAWLDRISAQKMIPGLDIQGPDSLSSLGPGFHLSAALYKELRVGSYVLPISSGQTSLSDHASSAQPGYQLEDMHRLAAYAGWLKSGSASADDDAEQLGNSAKVAVFLSASLTKVAKSLEQLICKFSSEQTYGHEVRVFSPPESELNDMSLTSCPEVEIESAVSETMGQWKPEICLSSTKEAIPASLRCTRIVVGAVDLPHLDWLASLPLESLQNWHTPRIELVVITNNRTHSLHRLLTSLSSAVYFNDTVNLNINLEQTADARTSQLVYDASWPHGNLSLRRRIILGELMPAIVESWYPTNNDSYGVLLEDDVEVSPHFYAWIKFAILQYRYGPRAIRASSRSMTGISLYQPKNIELRMEGRRKFDAHRIFADIGISATTPYLSQIPCSWGAVYFPEHWREFHQYLILRLGEVALELSEPIVPDIRSNRWHKSWKRYMIELMYVRGYSMLYPNYEGFRSLSTNHLELGTHVKDFLAAQKRKASFEVPLLQLEDSVLEGLLDDHLPSWDGLPLLDFWGALATHGEVLQRASITLDELALCPAPSPDQVSIEREQDDADIPEVTYRYDASELLCPRAVPTVKKTQDTITTLNGAVTPEEREAMLAEREAAVLERETRLAELEELGFDFSGEEVLVDA